MEIERPAFPVLEYLLSQLGGAGPCALNGQMLSRIKPEFIIVNDMGEIQTAAYCADEDYKR